MPDIKLRNQPFDLDFHPSEPLLFSSLLTGEVKAWRYDDQTGESSSAWSIRPTKRAARCVTVSEEGNNLWMGGKGGGLYQINPEDGAMKKERADVHDVPINRVKCINPNLVVSGDDDGVIKFWDPRKEDAIKTYTHHFDYISDFAYFDDKRHLVTTSGDGHLSVIDIRSNKPEPLSISDDQEDELLSIIPIKGGAKAVVGSTLGILSIFNRSKGWQDCVDRIPGHPASIDALVALTPDVIATGSEDGMIRVIQVLPHKFLGVIATHEEYPIERIKLDRNGKWLGSVSHDECIKLTDVENILEDSDDEGGEDESMDQDSDDEAAGEAAPGGSDDEEEGDGEAAEDADSDSDEDMDVQPKKEKKKKGKGGMDLSRADRQTQDSGFFDGL